MPRVESHAPGTFCWIELATTDQAGAKSFYSSIFGWTPVDSPIGPNDYYTIFKRNGADAAAAFTMKSALPHWNPYFAVESADSTAGKVAALGGTVIEPPFDVTTHGRAAVIQDPTGAIFSIWQPGDNSGTKVKGESGTMVWADLHTPDPARAQRFYEGLFGWNIGPAENYPPQYLLIAGAEGRMAGIGPILP